MKKLLCLAIIIATPLLMLSCQNDTEKEPFDKPFKSVTVSLSATMGMDDNTQTKAEQYPTNDYELDEIYLMVKTGEGVYKSHQIDLVTVDGKKKFNLRITSISPTEISLATNDVPLTTVAPGQDLFFSSHGDCLVETYVTAEYTTPQNGDVYAPFGKDLYKSAHSGITIIDNGFIINGKEYIANQDNELDLVMYRLTGSFRAKVIFFQKEEADTPLAVTASDWETIGLGASDQWTVTPYLRNYYHQFLICDGIRGTATGALDATYILAKGDRPLVMEDVEVHTVSEGSHELYTLVAGTSESYFPYLFNGLLMNSTISFVIKNNATEDIWTIEDEIKDLIFADVVLKQELMPNDFKTLNLCINIQELYDQTLKSGVIDNKNVFYFWE